MISKIEAINYRCFRELNLKLRSYQVLAGVNGSGKSTLIDIPILISDLLTKGIAPAFLESLASKSPRAITFQELIYNGQGDSFGLVIEVKFNVTYQSQPQLALFDNNCDQLRYELEFKIIQDNLVINQEYLYQFDYNQVTESVKGIGLKSNNYHLIIQRTYGNPIQVFPENKINPNYPNLDLNDDELALANLPKDKTLFPLSIKLKNLLQKEAIYYDPSYQKLKIPVRPGQPKIIKSDASNLASLIMNLQQESPDFFQLWLAHIKQIFPNISKIESVTREEDYYNYLKFTYTSGYIVTSSSLSYGMLRILALTILPYLPLKHSLIFVEEPENGIHPQAIQEVLQSLSSVYDSQVWLSTHSPVVLSHTDLDSLIIMKPDNQQGVVAIIGTEHPDLKNWRTQF